MPRRIQQKDTFWLFWMTVSVCLLFAGGRIASSDENVFFLETRSIVEHGTLAIPEGIVDNGVRGADGRYYVGAGIGYTLLSIPFYLLGKLLTAFVASDSPFIILILKGAFSLTNQFLVGFLSVMIYGFARSMGFSKRTGFVLTVVVLFTTNIFPYTKSAMRDIAVILCVVGSFRALFEYKQSGRNRDIHIAGAWLAWMLTLKISFVILIPCVALYVVLLRTDTTNGFSNFLSQIRAGVRHQAHALSILSMWIAIGLGTVAIYQWMIFGNPFASGYSERNAASFSTPLFVGLYGLLLSSGKSFFLYAPVTILFFVAARRFRERFRQEFIFIVSMSLVMVVFHAKFFSWAADGSWGPRYLLPLIPLLVFPIGLLLDQKLYRRWFVVLAILGGVIQLGGSAVYLGSYLRHIGEFPFTREFTDPEFMYKSHFVPNFSPVVGHWDLLLESLQVHRNGGMDHFQIASGDARLPVADADRERLVYIIDFWFMYAYYAGLRPMGCVLMAFVAALFAGMLSWRTAVRFLRE